MKWGLFVKILSLKNLELIRTVFYTVGNFTEAVASMVVSHCMHAFSNVCYSLLGI